MAGLWAVLPAQEAVRVDAALDAGARGARSAGDPRTLDQLRADLLCDVVAGSAAGGAGGGATGDLTSDGGAGGGHADRDHTAVGDPADASTILRRPPVRSTIQVTVPLSVLLGMDDAPGELGGYGAITAGQRVRWRSEPGRCGGGW